MKTEMANESERWEAVQRRDPASDGLFFYSVRTTGVYCRPSCAARLARRENVRFHPTCTDAENAGYRPCKRCRPNEPPLAERQASAVAKACRFIEDAEEMPALDTLASAVGMSPFHFHRVFKAATGLSPKAYADGRRTSRVREQLTSGVTVTQAIYGAGYNSNGRFYATTAKLLGMTPTDFRDGGVGATVRFGVGECSLGSILVAASGKGVCAILLGNDPDRLTRDLQDRFPR
ncbi:MAG: Ada metal-binding domain-containing protein, partial [Bryobacteraceae bacterium]